MVYENNTAIWRMLSYVATRVLSFCVSTLPFLNSIVCRELGLEFQCGKCVLNVSSGIICLF